MIDSVSFDRGELWEVKTVGEIGKTDNNSFCAVRVYADSLGKTSGVSVWTQHDKADQDFIRFLQPSDGYTFEQKWQNLCWDHEGAIYNRTTSADFPFIWPRVILGSRSLTERNRVRISEWQGDYGKLVGIGPDDYHRSILVLLQNGLAHRVNCMPFHTDIQRYSDTPKGICYMPIFDPTKYKHSLGEADIWIPKSSLFKRLV